MVEDADRAGSVLVAHVAHGGAADLSNRLQMFLWWGPQFIQLYNDASWPALGDKHPRSLGQPASECWAEIWDIIGPLIETPFRGGPATWMDDIFLHMNRKGFMEETHWTIAYSPVLDDRVQGGIGGVIGTVNEITEKVVGERRVLLLRDLGARSSEPKTAEEACAIAAETLAHYREDVPFALLYLISDDRKIARLADAAGVATGLAESPLEVDLVAAASDGASWPLAEAFRSETMRLVEDLPSNIANVAPGPWPDPPRAAAVYPIPSNVAHQLAGLLVLGVSSHLVFDDRYRGFFDLVTSQVAATIANARAYEEERKRAEALAEIDRVKTAFFSNVSHEFRTPLTLMLGPIEDMLSRAGPAFTGSREELELVHRNGLRMLKLVNTLLDFSRIEAGRIKGAYEPVNLAAFTADLASVFRSMIEKAGLRFAVDCRPLPELVHVDRNMWEKIVLNLLSNAFKFTFEGEIALSLSEDSGFAELSVRDTGTGIAEHELPRLFERFHRVEGARGRTFEGSGIGLALVLEMVKLHGGTARVESTLGRGSCFTVSVPFGKAHLPAGHIGATQPKPSPSAAVGAFVEEALRWLPQSSDEGAPLAASRHFSASSSELPSILLADDNADMREYIQRLLRGSYEVRAVGDGEAALAAIAEKPPDLVLTDIMMPRLDGFGLLRELRADARTRGIPVILLSARAGEEATVEGLEAGASDYLVKPFSAPELRARVRTGIMVKRARDALQEELASQDEDLSSLAGELVASRRSLRQSLDAQMESEQRWHAIFENSAVGIVLTDTGGRFLATNPALQEMLGFTEEELQKLSIMELTLAEELAATRSHLDGLAQGSLQKYQLERRLIRKDGSAVWVHATVSVIPRSERLPQMFVGVLEDISTRKQAEEALRESEQKYRTLFESIDEGFCIVEVMFDANDKATDYRFLEISPSFEKQTGIKNARGRRMREIAPQHEEHWFEIYGGIALTGEPARFENTATQLSRWYDVYAFRVGEPQERKVGILFNDITERKRTEQELRTSEERFRRYFDLGLIGMAITSPSKGCIEVNDELCRILGYSRSELLQKSWPEMTHPDDLAVDVTQFERVMAGEMDGYSVDKRWIRKDGRVIDSIMAAQCVRCEDGSVDYFVGLVLDTTERKRAQYALRLAQHELAHAYRVLSMGELSASIAHELNQPLAAISANGHASLRWLAREIPDLEEAQTAIEGMLRDAIRAGEVLLRIRAFSTKGTPAQHVSLDLNEVIREALTLMRDELLAHRVALCTELSPELLPVLGDRVQLQQVFLNLIRNGVEAMDTVTERPRELRIRCWGENAHEVIVTVQDSGIGLDPAEETRLFDAFFTTKGQGMGLGLSISRRIVEWHGGRLWATSGGGFGSTFHCVLPIETDLALVDPLI